MRELGKSGRISTGRSADSSHADLGRVVSIGNAIKRKFLYEPVLNEVVPLFVKRKVCRLFFWADGSVFFGEKMGQTLVSFFSCLLQQLCIWALKPFSSLDILG
jgi:hypothetical protein